MNGKWKEIRYLVIDVDGTMTDSGIYYDEHGNELKRFSTRDAAGFFAAHKAGISLIVLTGRECAATTRRMEEMKFDHIFQKVRDKKAFLAEFMKEHGIRKEEIGYIGDDLNDLLPMELCGFIACPSDACEEVRAAADIIGASKGGYGAVRDCIFLLLKARGEYEEAVTGLYDSGK
ncbi:MAG: HAD hydrolase family protein [Lachnospiraceae bacterium]|nr:HAD hydrolase family protein [Lachnospiraceae bacterium]